MSTRAERVAAAARLRADGLLLREIAERMGGVSVKTVSDWLNDPDGAKLAARKESYRGSCELCGAPTSGHNGRGPRAPRYCAHCGPMVTGDINRERARPRREAVERAWAEGKTCREMMEMFGWADRSSIAVLRRRGYDLPHRRSPEQVERIRAGYAKARAARADRQRGVSA